MRFLFTDYKKAPQPFICWGVLLWTLGFSIPAASDENCALQGPAETVILKQVYDGDTIELTDGRKIRVLGINTPELLHHGEPLEPLATEARQAALHFLSQTSSIKIKLGTQQQDQYKRWLASVYTDKGENLSAYLLRQGLAAHIIIPPNVDDTNCLHEQEEKARLTSLGIWKHPYFKARQADRLILEDAGFRFVVGTVDNITTSDEAWWFTLDDEVEVKINKLAWPYLTLKDIQQLQGKKIIVRGWLVNKNKYVKDKPLESKWIISIHHPFMIEEI